MPDLIAKDDRSVSLLSLNVGGSSANKAFKNLELVMCRTSDRIRANQDVNNCKKNPSLASTSHKLSDHVALLSSVQSNETCALKEVQKEPDFKEFVKSMKNEMKDHETRNR